MVADEPGRAGHSGDGPQLTEDDGEIARGQRQGLPVDLGADAGQQVVAEPGHPAADHDEARVEEADESGDDLADPVPALADQVQRRGVTGRRGGGHVDGRQRAGRLQPGRQFRGSAGPRGVLGVTGEGRAAEVGFQAALVAAGAGAPVGFDLDVADVMRRCPSYRGRPLRPPRCRSRYPYRS